MTEQEVEQLVRKTFDTLFGRNVDSFDIDRIDFLAAAVTSAKYAQQRMRKVSRLPNSPAILDFALREAPPDGLILEFGVASGGTINFIAERTARQVYGFDVFSGLPEDWRPGFPSGRFASAGLPSVRSNVELVVGLFDRTLPEFFDKHPGTISFAHIDCDLYSATNTVLHHIRSRIIPGSVLLFDEYFNYPEWEMHEFRAFREFVTAYDVSYEYIGLVPSHQQVAVRIIR